MTTRIATVLLVLVSSSVLLDARASDLKQMEQALNATYKGKTMILRNFYRGKKLDYDAQGKLVKGGRSGPWTLCAGIEVGKVRLRPKNLTINGTRIFLIPRSKDKFEHRPDEWVSIRVEMASPPASMEPLHRLLATVFLSAEEKLADVVPDYWKGFFYGESTPEPRGGDGNAGAAYSYLGKDPSVTPPIPIHKPMPGYTPEARDAKLQGTTVLFFVVDAQGGVADIRVVKPLGYGLDDNAVETVRRWKFKPGVRNGRPVAVCLMVEVAFRSF
ncbi:MAG: energy transducer TonB [Terriglobia bacterium]